MCFGSWINKVRGEVQLQNSSGRAQWDLPSEEKRALAWSRAIWGKPPWRLLPALPLLQFLSISWPHTQPANVLQRQHAWDPGSWAFTEAFSAFLQGLVFSPVRFLSVSDSIGIHVPFRGFHFVICTVSYLEDRKEDECWKPAGKAKLMNLNSTFLHCTS